MALDQSIDSGIEASDLSDDVSTLQAGDVVTFGSLLTGDASVQAGTILLNSVLAATSIGLLDSLLVALERDAEGGLTSKLAVFLGDESSTDAGDYVTNSHSNRSRANVLRAAAWSAQCQARDVDSANPTSIQVLARMVSSRTPCVRVGPIHQSDGEYILMLIDMYEDIIKSKYHGGIPQLDGLDHAEAARFMASPDTMVITAGG